MIGAAVCTDKERIVNGTREIGRGEAVDASERGIGEGDNASEREAEERVTMQMREEEERQMT